MEPHTSNHRPPTAAELAHDAAMLEALKDVHFGSFNQNDQFYKDLRTNGVKTDRQRWWLTTLVVRHRKQLKPQFHGTLARAQRWLTEHKQAGETTPRASNASGTHPDARTEPLRSTDPTLFP